MSEHVIAGLRWFLLAAAVLSLLQATVLFRFFERYMFAPWFRLNERLGAQIPLLMRDARVRRAWPLFMTVVLLTLWWFLGTPAGRDILLHANSGSGH